jgi:hypothetical protein
MKVGVCVHFGNASRLFIDRNASGPKSRACAVCNCQIAGARVDGTTVWNLARVAQRRNGRESLVPTDEAHVPFTARRNVARASAVIGGQPVSTKTLTNRTTSAWSTCEARNAARHAHNPSRHDQRRPVRIYQLRVVGQRRLTQRLPVTPRPGAGAAALMISSEVQDDQPHKGASSDDTLFGDLPLRPDHGKRPCQQCQAEPIVDRASCDEERRSD